MNVEKQIDDLHEALASTESELRDAREALARVEAAYANRLRNVKQLESERDTAQAQLAEAVRLLDDIDIHESEIRAKEVSDFLARHAQAEQQEAQGAQAGGELIRKVSVALARSPEITPDEARRVRAALATQPAVRGAEHE